MKNYDSHQCTGCDSKVVLCSTISLRDVIMLRCRGDIYSNTIGLQFSLTSLARVISMTTETQHRCNFCETETTILTMLRMSQLDQFLPDPSMKYHDQLFTCKLK